MQLYQKLTQAIKTAIINHSSNREIFNAYKDRFGDPATKQASTGIVPYYIGERRVELEDWRRSVDLALNPITLNRYEYIRIADNAMLDLHLTSVTDTRILECQHTKAKMVDPSGKLDNGAIKLLEAQWYNDYQRYVLESILYGHSLIEMWDLKDTANAFKLNSGTKQVFELKSADLIDRKHVRPESEVWVINTFDQPKFGISYTDPIAEPYYISVGKKHDLGILKKIIPVVLAKRYSVGAWGDYNEKLGIPFRWVTMQGTDKKREQFLAEIMDQMGYAGWAVLHEGEKIELLQASGGDVHKCFKELSEFSDRQMSKGILGSTMVTDAEGGNYKGEVHAETTEIRHMADKMFIQYINNDQLLPKLVKRGYPLAGYRYEIDDTKELSLSEQIKIDTVLLQHYNIKPKYISDKYDIPEDMIEGKSASNVQDILTEQSKKKVQARGLKTVIGEYSATIINSVEKQYFGKNCCNKPILTGVKSATTEGYSLINEVIKGIFKGEIKAGELHEGLYDWQVNALFKGLKEGYGEGIGGIHYNDSDADVVTSMKENIFVFSAFKNEKELRAMSDMLVDTSGNIKPYSQFKKDVLAVHDTYDKRFLAAEYDNAVVSAQAVTKWQRFSAEKERFPMLRYNAIIDGGTTQLCNDLNGTTLRFDHVFWNKYMIPNHWGERADIDQVSDGEETANVPNPDVADFFSNNVGKTGIIFPDKHPYYQASKAATKEITDFAKTKFKGDGQ
jgi:hypothetical protein